jgi:hypothetical protein
MEPSHLEILLEDIRAKFDLVLEGHEALLVEIRETRRESNEKHELTALQIRALSERLESSTATLHAKIDDYRRESNEKHDLTVFQLRVLNGKVDAFAADLAAHRADTEAHPRYLVRE